MYYSQSAQYMILCCTLEKLAHGLEPNIVLTCAILVSHP